MQKFIKKLMAMCFILLLVTGCTRAEENKPLVFESPITSTKAHYSGRKFNRNFSFDLSSNSEAAIKEKMTDHLIYEVELEDVVPEVEFDEDVIYDYFDFLSDNFYRIPVDKFDIRIRDTSYLRLDQYERGLDNVKIVTDDLKGIHLIGAITEGRDFFQGFSGNIHYGLARDKELSVFNQTFKYLVFRNFDNVNFEVGDVFIYEIPLLTVDELNPGVKYQDGKFEEYFSEDYVDYNTVIQFY